MRVILSCKLDKCYVQSTMVLYNQDEKYVHMAKTFHFDLIQNRKYILNIQAFQDYHPIFSYNVFIEFKQLAIYLKFINL